MEFESKSSLPSGHKNYITLCQAATADEANELLRCWT